MGSDTMEKVLVCGWLMFVSRAAEFLGAANAWREEIAIGDTRTCIMCSPQ